MATTPKKPEPKAQPARGVMRSGLDHRFAAIEGEDRADFLVLTDMHFRVYQPATPVERYLVDVMIRAEWSARRLMRVETELFESSINSEIQEHDVTGRAFDRMEQKFMRLQRWVTSWHRLHADAFERLRKLQAERAKLPEAAQPPVLDEANVNTMAVREFIKDNSVVVYPGDPPRPTLRDFLTPLWFAPPAAPAPPSPPALDTA